MQEKIMCKFEITKQNFYDYYKTLLIFKVCDCLIPSLLAISSALIITITF